MRNGLILGSGSLSVLLSRVEFSLSLSSLLFIPSSLAQTTWPYPALQGKFDRNTCLVHAWMAIRQHGADECRTADTGCSIVTFILPPLSLVQPPILLYSIPPLSSGSYEMESQNNMGCVFVLSLACCKGPV